MLWRELLPSARTPLLEPRLVATLVKVHRIHERRPSFYEVRQKQPEGLKSEQKDSVGFAHSQLGYSEHPRQEDELSKQTRVWQPTVWL